MEEEKAMNGEEEAVQVACLSVQSGAPQQCSTKWRTNLIFVIFSHWHHFHLKKFDTIKCVNLDTTDFAIKQRELNYLLAVVVVGVGFLTPA